MSGEYHTISYVILATIVVGCAGVGLAAAKYTYREDRSKADRWIQAVAIGMFVFGSLFGGVDRLLALVTKSLGA